MSDPYRDKYDDWWIVHLSLAHVVIDLAMIAVRAHLMELPDVCLSSIDFPVLDPSWIPGTERQSVPGQNGCWMGGMNRWSGHVTSTFSAFLRT